VEPKAVSAVREGPQALIPRLEMESRPNVHERARQSIGFSPDTLLGVPALAGTFYGINEVTQ
jgi:hypothetical protein